jgi:hypothetical protein
MSTHFERLVQGPEGLEKYARAGGWDSVEQLLQEVPVVEADLTGSWFPSGESRPYEPESTRRSLKVAYNVSSSWLVGLLEVSIDREGKVWIDSSVLA